MQLTLTPVKRLLLLLCFFIVGFFIVSVVTAIIGLKGEISVPAMRIIILLQDLLVFIMPAIVTAMLVTRQPATLLCIDRRIPWVPMILGICVLISSIPAMNAIVWLNEQAPLPQYFRVMEDSAGDMVSMLTGEHTIGNLIMSILLVGIMAGLSEELLFRGAFQRLMSTGGVKVHAAIWISAVVFSTVHFQFFGFVPRVLLGAFFGYMLYWTKSLWVPIILHALNNTIVLVTEYLTYNPADPDAENLIDKVGAGSDFLLVATSAAMVTIGLWLIRKECQRADK